MKLGYLLCIGGIDNLKNSAANSSQYSFIEKYDVRNENWVSLNSTSNINNNLAINGSMNSINLNVSSSTGNVLKRLQFGVAVKDSNIILICGGRDGLKTLSTGFYLKKKSFFLSNLIIYV